MARKYTKEQTENWLKNINGYVKTNGKKIHRNKQGSRFLDTPDFESKPIEKKQRKLIPIEEWKKLNENNDNQ